MNKKNIRAACISLLMLASIGMTDSANTLQNERIFLKKDGDRWLKVAKGRDGIRILGEASIQEVQAQNQMGRAEPQAVQAVTTWFQEGYNIETGSRPESVAVADLNGDGRKDVAMVTSDNFGEENDYKLLVFLQNSSGGLDDPEKYDIVINPNYRYGSVDCGDLNNDGRIDVAVIWNFGIGVFLQNASGDLDPVDFYPTQTGLTYVPTDLRIGDFNNDDLSDVCCIVPFSNDFFVFYQNSGGTLNSAVSYQYYYEGASVLEVGDLNNDGRTDVLIKNGSQNVDSIAVFIQNTGGGFAAAAFYDHINELYGWYRCIGIGDFNGDSRNDVVAVDDWEYTVIYPQNSGGTFNLPNSYDSSSNWAVISGDVNGDGLDDVITSSWLMLQKSDNTLDFSETLNPIYATTNPHGIAYGDINSDGFKDLVVASPSFGLGIYHGKAGNDNPGPGPSPGPGPNDPVVAVPACEPYVYVGQQVTVDGSLSFSPRSSICTYEWHMDSRPQGSNAQLSATQTESVCFFADQPGIYHGTLVVCDCLNACSDPREFQVEATYGRPPIVSLQAQRKTVNGTMIRKDYAELNIDVIHKTQVPAKVSRYVLQRRIEGGVWETIDDFLEKAAWDTWSQTHSYKYLDRYIDRDKTYSYQVLVFNDRGEMIASDLKSI